ncbi:MAG: tetratricopeptide repeat protein [Bacteroidota bacterium]|nr:tetratricopeptide repeat protein [Bacteroidota bacterium]
MKFPVRIRIHASGSSFCRTILSVLLLVSLAAAQDTKENADLKLALNLYNDKMYDLALEQLRQFVSTYPASPQSIDAKFYIAKTYQALGKLDEARAAFQNFALAYSDNAKASDAWWSVGELYAQRADSSGDKKDYANAASSFERIKVFQPKSKIAPKALLKAAEYFDKASDPEDAKRVLSSLFTEYPADPLVPEAHLRLGQIFFREGNLISAGKELAKAREAGANDELKGKITIELGKLAEAEGNRSEAENLYRSLIENGTGTKRKAEESFSPSAAQARLLLGELLHATGRSDDAEEQFKTLTEDSSVVAKDILQQALCDLGKVLYEQKKYKSAAAAFSASLNYPVDSSLVFTVRLRLGESCTAMKEYRRALDAYAPVIAYSGTLPEKRLALIRSALASVKLKEYTAAAKFYTQFMGEFPSDKEIPGVLFRTAEIERNFLQDGKKAAALYEEFLLKYEKNKLVDDAEFGLGEAYELMHDNVAAMKAYDDILTQYKSSPFYENARERKEFLQNYHTPDREKGTEQLALLMGDLILEKPRAELAMRLGDIYANILLDYQQAAEQYRKVESISTDSTVHEAAAYKRTQALMKLTQEDTASLPDTKTALLDFITHYPAGKHAQEVEFDLFSLQLSGAGATKRIDLCKQFLNNYPESPFVPDVLLVLGNAYRDKGFMDASIQTYKLLATKFPLHSDAPEATAMLGIQLAHLGRSDTASIVMNDYLQSNPGGEFAANVLYEKGMLNLRDGRAADAAEAFEEVRSKFFYTEFADESLDPLAQSYQKLGKFDNAEALYLEQLQALRSPVQDHPKAEAATVLKLAETYDTAGDTSNAKKYYTEYLSGETTPDNASTSYYRLALFDEQNGNSSAALDDLENSVAALRTATNTAALSSLCFSNGKYDRAIREYTALQKLSDADSSQKESAQVNTIIALFRSDKSKEAEAKIVQFKKEHGSDAYAEAEFTLEKAQTLFRGEKYTAAMDLLQSFASANDTSSLLGDASFWIGKIFEVTNQSDSAMARYMYTLKTFPQSSVLPKVYLALGNIYYFKEKYDEAIKYYRLIVDKPSLAPDLLPFAMNNLIEAYKQVGLYDGAMDLIRDFISRYPNDQSVLDKKIDLGILYQKLGYYDQAILQLQSVLDLANKDVEAEVRYYIGESEYDKGDYQQAILEFLKVPYLITQKTKLDWTPNAYYMCGQSYEKMGKLDQAVTMYQQIVDKPGIDAVFKSAAQKEITRVKGLMNNKSMN